MTQTKSVSKASRATLERRARKIGLTITGDHDTGYYLDRVDVDYFDRRYEPYATLREVEEAIEYCGMYASW